MPWFRKSDDERQHQVQQRQRQAEAQADQEMSLASLARGGIPVQAQRRLEDIRSEAGRLFTSDLSVNEFLLAREIGIKPITQVMGSSIYHVGWQPTPNFYFGFGLGMELDVISRAMNHARALALNRMLQEAQLAGADAVIGVRIQRGTYDWAADLIEFSAVGTAVALGSGRRVAEPLLTNLSGQDFWKLRSAGYSPQGVVAASTVYYVVASWQTQRASSLWSGWANQELQDFTQGVYSARHLVMSRLQEQAGELRAGGVVGMNIQQSSEEHAAKLGNDQERTDLIVTFHAIGTAVVQSTEESPSIHAALSLG